MHLYSEFWLHKDRVWSLALGLSILSIYRHEYVSLSFQMKTEYFILLNHLNWLRKPDPLTLTCGIQQILNNSAFSEVTTFIAVWSVETSPNSFDPQHLI